MSVTGIESDDELPTLIRPFVEAVRDKPDYPRRLAEMAATLANRLGPREALDISLRARALAPGDAFVWRLTETLVRRLIPEWHWAIVRDTRRNDVYDRAVRANVTAETTVLEIGTGTGILAMMAARAGAAHVYSCEIEPALARAARENIARNGYADRITVIEADAGELTVGAHLPRRCDVLLHEIISNDLLSENVLALTEHARAALLEPDAIHLPDAIWATGQIVSDDWPIERIRLANHAGFDLRAINLTAPAIGAHNGPTEIKTPLSDPFEIIRFDLQAGAARPPRAATLDIPVVADGTAAIVLQWIGFSFPGGLDFENGPQTRSSWAHRFHPLEPPVDVRTGDTFRLICEYRSDILTMQPA